jgi:hypothetical protein
MGFTLYFAFNIRTRRKVTDSDELLEGVKNGPRFLLNALSVFMELSPCFIVQKGVIDNKFNIIL